MKYGIHTNIFAEKMWVAFAKATYFFFSKNICELEIVLTRTVNILTTNELVKLTMLWTAGPRSRNISKNHYCILILETSGANSIGQIFFFFYFSKKMRLDIHDCVFSASQSTSQANCMTCQALLFFWKNEQKNTRMLSAAFMTGLFVLTG